MHFQRETLGEEIANSISHGVGLVASILALPILTISAIVHGETMEIVGAIVFASTMILLYLASTLYHTLPPGRAKRIFRILDHSAIYVFIAGSYTPFTIGVLRGETGWALLGAIWTFAILGVAWKATGIRAHPMWSAGLYLAMGWLIVLAAEPLIEVMPRAGLAWLVAGGLAYTGGVGFFVATGLRYGHFVWHLFVLTGSACHTVAVFAYAA
jgi:hemolysin III